MCHANVQRQHHRTSNGAARLHKPIPADVPMCQPAPWNHALAFAIEADHNSEWPTHRIRGFLLSQQLKNSSRTPC